MEHPCKKECLKYPVCKNKKRINCTKLYSYYIYLLFESDKIHRVEETYVAYGSYKEVTARITCNLPNIIEIGVPTSNEASETDYTETVFRV